MFFAAVLGSSATVSVTIGGVVSAATWTHFPSNGVGLYRGSVDLNGRTGAVNVAVTRTGTLILSATGDSITTACNSNMQNWNPYVIGTLGRTIAAVAHTPLSQLGCTSGFGKAKYGTLCEIACKYGYCPKGACTCTSIVSSSRYVVEFRLTSNTGCYLDKTYRPKPEWMPRSGRI